jgi:hypothetical protein
MSEMKLSAAKTAIQRRSDDRRPCTALPPDHMQQGCAGDQYLHEDSGFEAMRLSSIEPVMKLSQQEDEDLKTPYWVDEKLRTYTIAFCDSRDTLTGMTMDPASLPCSTGLKMRTIWYGRPKRTYIAIRDYYTLENEEAVDEFHHLLYNVLPDIPPIYPERIYDYLKDFSYKGEPLYFIINVNFDGKLTLEGSYEREVDSQRDQIRLYIENSQYSKSLCEGWYEVPLEWVVKANEPIIDKSLPLVTEETAAPYRDLPITFDPKMGDLMPAPMYDGLHGRWVETDDIVSLQPGVYLYAVIIPENKFIELGTVVSMRGYFMGKRYAGTIKWDGTLPLPPPAETAIWDSLVSLLFRVYLDHKNHTVRKSLHTYKTHMDMYHIEDKSWKFYVWVPEGMGVTTAAEPLRMSRFSGHADYRKARHVILNFLNRLWPYVMDDLRETQNSNPDTIRNILLDNVRTRFQKDYGGQYDDSDNIESTEHPGVIYGPFLTMGMSRYDIMRFLEDTVDEFLSRVQKTMTNGRNLPLPFGAMKLAQEEAVEPRPLKELLGEGRHLSDIHFREICMPEVISCDGSFKSTYYIVNLPDGIYFYVKTNDLPSYYGWALRIGNAFFMYNHTYLNEDDYYYFPEYEDDEGNLVEADECELDENHYYDDFWQEAMNNISQDDYNNVYESTKDLSIAEIVEEYTCFVPDEIFILNGLDYTSWSWEERVAPEWTPEQHRHAVDFMLRSVPSHAQEILSFKYKDTDRNGYYIQTDLPNRLSNWVNSFVNENAFMKILMPRELPLMDIQRVKDDVQDVLLERLKRNQKQLSLFGGGSKDEGTVKLSRSAKEWADLRPGMWVNISSDLDFRHGTVADIGANGLTVLVRTEEGPELWFTRDEVTPATGYDEGEVRKLERYLEDVGQENGDSHLHTATIRRLDTFLDEHGARVPLDYGVVLKALSWDAMKKVYREMGMTEEQAETAVSRLRAHEPERGLYGVRFKCGEWENEANPKAVLQSLTTGNTYHTHIYNLTPAHFEPSNQRIADPQAGQSVMTTHGLTGVFVGHDGEHDLVRLPGAAVDTPLHRPVYYQTAGANPMGVHRFQHGDMEGTPEHLKVLDREGIMDRLRSMPESVDALTVADAVDNEEMWKALMFHYAPIRINPTRLKDAALGQAKDLRDDLDNWRANTAPLPVLYAMYHDEDVPESAVAGLVSILKARGARVGQLWARDGVAPYDGVDFLLRHAHYGWNQPPIDPYYNYNESPIPKFEKRYTDFFDMLQHAASDLYGIPVRDHQGIHMSRAEYEDLMKPTGADIALQAYLETVRKNTAKWFTDNGLDRVLLFRGWSFNTPNAIRMGPSMKWDGSRISNVYIPHRPISPYSVSVKEASRFAYGKSIYRGDPAKDIYSMVTCSIVPAENILSLPFTGFGYPRLGEIIVCSDELKCDVVGFRWNEGSFNADLLETEYGTFWGK